MNVLEKVRQMQQQGATEESIVNALRETGVSYKDISEALTQTKIKAAVEDSEEQTNNETESPPQDEAVQGLQQSMMQQSAYPENQETQEYVPAPLPSQPQSFDYAPQYGEYYPQSQTSQEGAEYQPYEYQQPGISTDTITEISEQIVSEKMTDIRKMLEKVIDFKTTMDAKVSYIDDRIKRIEKIIDTLQSSVLRKVGDYVTNVEDIKKELIETQKSFTKFFPELKKEAKKHSGKHHHEHEHKTKKHKSS